MPEKDPSSYTALTYAWVIMLSVSGGIVSFFRKVNSGHARLVNLTELLGEVFTSGFTGIITFWLCESAEIDPLVSAAMVGISGHMGSRVIYQLETWLAGRLPHG